jgi:hypothetical protein
MPRIKMTPTVNSSMGLASLPARAPHAHRNQICKSFFCYHRATVFATSPLGCSMTDDQIKMENKFGIKTRSAFANKWKEQFLLTTMLRVKQSNAVAVSRRYQPTNDSTPPNRAK